MTMRPFALSCLLLTLPLAAQEQPVGVPPPAAAKAPLPAVTVTLSFPGGTLAEFCAMIRAKEAKANIVVAAMAASATLPAMDLRGAGLDQALEGACAIAESPCMIRMKDFHGAGEPVYTITAHPQQGPTIVTGVKKDGTEVLSLNRITDDAARGVGISPATVLSAIEAAVGGQQALASLLYHKESGLIIVRGSPEQLSTVNDVLRNLERDVEARRRQKNAERGVAPQPAEDKQDKQEKR